tara:strand:- start:14 stop:682 length:669 start_codon:yes stop_codon:yes gene_type:complete
MKKIILPNSYQTNTRNDVINFIISKKITRPTKILEIGGGAGHTTKILCEIFNCHGTNIDIKIPKIKAKGIDHLEMDMNSKNNSNKLTNKRFDLILALDVIEHIEDTDKLLDFIKSISSNNTYLFISLPNIKNIRVPFYIYFKNTFPRKNAGIFDKTHLRWFTKKDVIELIFKKGYQYVDSTYTDHKSRFIKNRLIEKIFGFLLAPQFIVCGQFKDDSDNRIN